MRKAWSLLTFGDDRQYGGNAGYDDDPKSVYKYDSKVPNHKKLAEGDFVVLRDKDVILGTATVSRILKGRGMKEFRRCPDCGSTSVRHRPSKSPKWRCDDNKHEFHDPLVENTEVDLFEAHFGSTFTAPSKAKKELSIDDLRAITLKRNDQLAIQRLDMSKLEALLVGDTDAEKKLFRVAASSQLEPDDFEEEVDGHFEPPITDRREEVLRGIKIRRGQKKFRNKLLKRYNSTCVITSCCIVEILEAAHILPYRGQEYNHPSNGLLLRTDIHTLFDLGLVQIHPESLQVFIDDNITDPQYRKFHGTHLQVNNRFFPSRASLRLRWGLFPS